MISIGGTMREYKNILVPTDFSENSFKAVEFGYFLAQKSNGKLHIIHVIEPLFQMPIEKVFDGERLQRARYDEAIKELNDLINRIPQSNVQVCYSILEGKPFNKIFYYTKDKKVDLIVMSTHGKTGLSSILMGSIAEKIVRLSEVPVITLKPNAEYVEKSNYSYRNTFAENWVG
jgi:Universal stress protein UspA and related nucleotide-binding proteins